MRKHIMSDINTRICIRAVGFPNINVIFNYSLRFRIRSRLGQQHGHQSTTLTSLFYKNIY
jgi:hypothetical protein